MAGVPRAAERDETRLLRPAFQPVAGQHRFRRV